MPMRFLRAVVEHDVHVPLATTGSSYWLIW
jgi:hypothetical protein